MTVNQSPALRISTQVVARPDPADYPRTKGKGNANNIVYPTSFIPKSSKSDSEDSTGDNTSLLSKISGHSTSQPDVTGKPAVKKPRPMNQNGLDEFLSGNNQPVYFDLAKVNLKVGDQIGHGEESAKSNDPGGIRALGKSRSTNPWDTLTTRYEVRNKIGEGGTSVVYRSMDQSIGREVALKRFKPGMGPETKGSEYEKEAKIISRVSHPNLVTTHDMGHDHVGHFIIMSLIDGKDLQEAYAGKSINIDHFESIAMQCLDGLNAIHNAGALHLDIKPSNVMVTQASSRRLHAQIIDFGSARLMQGEDQTVILEADENLHGSVNYMCPEQFDRAPLDARADIYSMGCLFYELLTGEQAFQGDTSIQVMAAHLQNRFTPLDQLRTDLPAGLADIVHKMISQNPQDRPASVEEITEALDQIDW